MSRTPTPLYREIAALVVARENCHKAGNSEWFDAHSDSLAELVGFLPSGSGIDCGTKLDLDRCKPGKLIFTFSYHHMDEHGGYDGWTEHTLSVIPSFSGIDLHITGRDRNQVKEYLYDIYHDTLSTLVWQDESGEWCFAHYGVPIPEGKT